MNTDNTALVGKLANALDSTVGARLSGTREEKKTAQRKVFAKVRRHYNEFVGTRAERPKRVRRSRHNTQSLG